MSGRKPKPKPILDGWDKAIEEAHARILRLKIAIAVFEEAKAKGEPWPEVK